MSTLRMRLTANGTEVWDANGHRWRSMDKGEATRLVSNVIAPKSYRRPKVRVVAAGKGGR